MKRPLESEEDKDLRNAVAKTKRPRALSGWNIFQREQLQQQSLSMVEYKTEIKSLSAIWKEKTSEEKAAYSAQAKLEESKREELANQPLPVKGEGKSELKLEVGRSGCKKISRKRLSQNECALAEHPMWTSSTQLGDSC